MFRLLFTFDGRIRRSQWWLGSVVLLVAVIVVVGVAVFAIRLQTPNLSDDFASWNPSPIRMAVVGLLYTVVLVVAMWCQIALNVKRLHDRGKSGWWMLLGVVPLVGLWLFIECGFLDGAPGSNDYGPSPKGLGENDMGQVFS